jgi:pSer/pThr/pTyr-binding forkhead associated (FHA) protein
MQTLTYKARRHAVPADMTTAGSYLEIGDGELLPLASRVTRLGRSLSADVEIDDGTVSRRHALIVQRDGRTVLLNDGSLNGTWHNGDRVERAVLRDGDVIALGAAKLRYIEVVELATDPLELMAAA